MKSLLKSLLHAFFLTAALPAAALSGFGKWESGFHFFAQAYALVPGRIGSFARIAFYRLTLERCSMLVHVSFGAFFAHPQARVGESVYIGAYSILGRVDIGDRTQIASGVQIISGKHQHKRGEDGQITGSDRESFETIQVGADCWIGAAAIVMADIGAGSTIGAGSVVTKAIPAGVVAYGNPCRVARAIAERVRPPLSIKAVRSIDSK